MKRFERLGRFHQRLEDGVKRLLRPFDSVMRPDSNSMVMRQTHFWSRTILWVIIGTIVISVLWACFAKMDEVIHAMGKLEPKGSVQEVQAPVPGVIAEVLVREGDAVSAGQPLIRLDPKVAEIEVKSLQEQLQSLKLERDFYESVLGDGGRPVAPDTVSLSVENLAKEYAALIAEDRLLRAIVESSGEAVALDADQRALLGTELRNYRENFAAIEEQLLQAREVEKSNADIFARYRDLAERNIASKVEMLQQKVQWDQAVARVKQLESAKENLATQFRMDARTRLGENTKELASVGSDLGRAKLNNMQRLAEVESRLAAAIESLEYHVIQSPSKGIVFELISGTSGTVVGAKDVVLKIVPSEELVAKIKITNKDIGFMRLGMPAEVEVESFPKMEFGYIDGEVVFIGSDALPPDEVTPTYTFPATVSLQRQTLSVLDKEIPLQSGMSVGVNLRVRDRRVINFFLDSLMGPVEKMREVR